MTNIKSLLIKMDISNSIRTNILDKPKWFIQRGKWGYADCDVWEMGNYLTRVILPMLKQLKKDKDGYPCNHRKGGCNCKQEWDTALSEMIEVFEAAKRVWDGDYPTDQFLVESRKDQRIFRRKMRMFTKYYFSLWD